MKDKTRNLSTIMLFITMLSLLLVSSPAFSMPDPGNELTVANGQYGTGSGGEFNLDLLYNSNNNLVDYVGFCYDRDLVIGFNGEGNWAEIDSFIVDTVVDISEQAIKWIYWKYAFDDQFGINSQSDADRDDLANWVQDTIWFLKGQLTGWTGSESGSESFYNTYVNGKSFSYDEALYDIKVLNLYYMVEGDSTHYVVQPMIVGEPVPEPTTMLLFATGLIGLAGFSYRRKKK